MVSSGSVPPSSDVLGKGFVWVFFWGGGQPFHCCFADLGGDGVKVWDGKGGRGVMS